MLHPYLVLRFRLDGIVTVVDAVNGLATLDAQPEAVKQIAVADRIVLAKSDLIDTPARRAAAPELLAPAPAPHPPRRPGPPTSGAGSPPRRSPMRRPRMRTAMIPTATTRASAPLRSPP